MLNIRQKPEVTHVGNYLVFNEGLVDTKMLMGWSQKRGSPNIVAEANLVNFIVLGMTEVSEPPSLLCNPFLSSVQREDVARMVATGNYLNLNKMGFGKTVETIEALRLLDARDTVIVAPKPVCLQWKEQYKVWWPEMYDQVSVRSFEGSTQIVNYEMLLQERVMAKIRNHRHQAVVFDEVHKIKNKGSKRTIAAKLIPADVHFGLTGTPILRQPDDLWSILNSVDSMYSGSSYWNFVNYFCNVNEGHFGRTIEGITQNASHLAILKTLLSAVSVRHAELEVAQGKRRIEVPIEMTPKQRSLYKKIKNLVLDELPESCTISNGAVLAMRLQQTTSWPGLYEVDEAGAKFEWVAYHCESTDDQIVIFSRFEKTAEALRAYLQSKKISCATYTGKKKPAEQLANKNLFIQGRVQVLIGTIDAMGTGVDGLQVAQMGIMLERSWSPEINEQCEDRLNRRGQTQTVLWYYPMCNKSFDQHVDRVNINKADSIRLALEAEE